MNNSLWIAYSGVVLMIIYSSLVSSHAFKKSKRSRSIAELKLEPIEAVVQVGANVTFICSYPSNVTFYWDFLSNTKPTKISNGVEISNTTSESLYFSKISLEGVNRAMSGEIICTANEIDTSTAGFLVVKGVKTGESCEVTADCLTDRATCFKGICTCPKNNVLIRLSDKGYEVCREMIHNLYDPCEFNEQCIHLVDEKSMCASNSICVCAPWTLDIKGSCVSRSEITYNKNQEMYRVGLIAVTCIIILIVALSLWITLNKSCREPSSRPQSSIRSTTSNFPERLQNDITSDKPPAYDDVLITQELSSPPTIKEALINCMTAKRLLRQVSAPAGHLLPSNNDQNNKRKNSYVNKVISKN